MAKQYPTQNISNLDHSTKCFESPARLACAIMDNAVFEDDSPIVLNVPLPGPYVVTEELKNYLNILLGAVQPILNVTDIKVVKKTLKITVLQKNILLDTDFDEDF